MPSPRSHVCQSAAANLSATRALEALVGLDGFVDEIVAVVDKRHDQENFDPVPTIAKMAQKIQAASGQSCNYELVVKQTKIGGSGPIMALALENLGVRTTCIGSLGYPDIHPIFSQLSNVTGIADPGRTQALEFEDGKLMLNQYRSLAKIDWEQLIGRVGEENLKKWIASAGLIAMNNWTMIPHMNQIWRKLALMAAGPGKIFFADLSDPEKRTRGDLLGAMETLREVQNHLDVILGLNLKEALAVAQAIGAPIAEGMLNLAQAIRQNLNLACVVVHPRDGAAAATRDGAAQFPGPFVNHPTISTGAGDHFNAGFCLGQMLAMTLEESLCLGTGCSGYFVRHAQSPTAGELAKFVSEMPDPEK
jgi:ketohexokinase